MVAFDEELSQNKFTWNETIEALCRHLCVMKGYDPDYVQSTDTGPYWNRFQESAENYLRNRMMNKYYWESLHNHDQ